MMPKSSVVRRIGLIAYIVFGCAFVSFLIWMSWR